MQLVFATHNRNKLNEIQALLPHSITLLSLDDINCTEEIPETASTLEGNARLKAQYVKQTYGYNCFADDTGLEVEALNNAPGVYSARYAGANNNAQANMQKLLQNLKSSPNRKARFKTVITLIIDNNEYLFNGICNGTITREQKGANGFGYDPIFQPEGFLKTFAQMTEAEKNTISHRARAINKLIRFLNA